MSKYESLPRDEKWRRLREACKSKKDELALELLASGAPANLELGRAEFSPLGWACLNDSVVVVEALCDRGADPWMDAQSPGLSAWEVAIGAASHASLRAMAERFHGLASIGGRRSPIEMILSKGRASDKKTQSGLAESARIVAARFSPKDSARFELHPLASAARAGLVDIAAVFLDAGVDPNQRSVNGLTALMLASKTEWKMCELLLSRGADPLLVDEAGATAFHWAVKRGSAEGVRALGRGPALKMRDAQGFLALERVDGWGSFPLSTAAKNGNKELAKALLAAGADPNARNPYGKTALMGCAMGSGVCGVLLSHGADPLLVDEDGSTALHWAVERGCAEAIRLLAKGPAMEMLDRGGRTAAQRAASARLSESAKACLESGILGMSAIAPDTPSKRPRL